MLGERGVFFSILWGLRQGEREAEHWEVQQLNSVHCNRTRAGRSRSPAFLQSAVYTHDCRCAMGRWEGGEGGCITTLSDKTYCMYLQVCSLWTRGDKSPFFIVPKC